MKKNLKLFFAFTLLLQINVVLSQNATVMNLYRHLPKTPNIQFFYGDYFYYSDNWLVPGSAPPPVQLHRFSLDTKKDTIIQIMSGGCNNSTYSNCIIEGSVIIGNNAYILMGNSFNRLNLNSLTWTAIQNYPSNFSMYNRAAIVTDNSQYIYVWGAYSSSWVMSNQLWRYDIINDSWFLLSTAPINMATKDGVYRYPYLIFGGGNEAWDVVRTYNLISNTWSTMPNPPLPQWTVVSSNYTRNEKYFVYNNLLYCIYSDFASGYTNSLHFSIYKYDDFSQTWTSETLNNYSTTINPGASPGSGDRIESFYMRNSILYFTNGFIDCMDGQSMHQGDPQINALSMKRQINLSIDSTSCYSSLDDSLIIYYRIEYAGSFNASNTSIFLSDVNNANTLQISSNSNFFSSNITVQNKSKTIHKNYLNYYLRAYNYQGTDTIISTNKFPVNNNIRYVPSGSITANPSLTFCSGQPVGAVLTVTNSTGNSYQWYLNNSILTGQNLINYTATQLGTYYCQIKSTNGCSNNTTPVTIQTVAIPTATITAVGSTTFCQGSSVILNAGSVSGLTYQWKNNGTNISGATLSSYTATTAGNYAATVTNSNSCSANSNTINISVQANPTVAVSNATICSGNTANLTATGANTYIWDTGATTSSISVSPTVTSNYLVTGTTNGCTNTKTVSVTIKNTPTIAVSNATICSGNNTNLTATGATTYSWNTGSTTSSISVTPNVNTNYTVTGTTNGCINTKTVSVTVKATPTVAVSNATICSGNSANITASGATTYSWNTGSATSSISITPNVNTNYTVTGTTNGCINTKTVSVTVKATPTLAISNATICSGNSTNLIASGAVSYSWNTGATSPSLNVSPIVNTNYVVIGTTNGCSDTKTVNVNVNQTPTVAVNSATICSGSNAVINASGATSYIWDNGATTNSISVTPNINTNYTVTGLSNSCSDTKTLSVTVNQTPIISVSNGTICSGNSYTITSSGAITYSYSGGSAIVSPISTSTYTVTGYSSQNCASSPQTLTVTVDPNSAITFQPTNQSVLSGTSAVFTVSATAGASLQWQTNLGLGFQNLSNAGQYSGVNTPTLTISNVGSSNNNQTFRCIVGTGSCGDTTIVVTLNLVSTVGIEDLASLQNIEVYPNPTSTQLYIKSSIKYSTIKVINSVGQIVLNKEAAASIDVSSFSNGLYFIKLYDEKGQLLKIGKFVKE